MKQWKIWTVERLMGESYKSARLELVMVMIVFTVLELGAEMLRLVVIFSEDSAAAGYHVDFIMINLEVRQDQEAEKNAVGKVLHDLIREAENRNPETVRQSLGRRTHAKNHVLLPEAGENPSLYRKDEKKSKSLSRGKKSRSRKKSKSGSRKKSRSASRNRSRSKSHSKRRSKSGSRKKSKSVSKGRKSKSLSKGKSPRKSLSKEKKRSPSPEKSKISSPHHDGSSPVPENN